MTVACISPAVSIACQNTMNLCSARQRRRPHSHDWQSPSDDVRSQDRKHVLDQKTAVHCVLEGNRAGNCRVCVRLSFAKPCPQNTLERSGSSCNVGCTKNKPRRPILRPLRGTKQIRPYCLQVPSQRHYGYAIKTASGVCDQDRQRRTPKLGT